MAAKSCAASVTAQLQLPAKTGHSGRRLFGVVNSGIPQGCPPHTAAEQAKLEIRSQLSSVFTAEQGGVS